MARIEALNILTTDSGKEYLSELYGKVIENVQKELTSSRMKNTDLSGSPTSGSVEAKRFVNAKTQEYGTAREARKGNAVKAKPVIVAIDQDKEIVEELEQKDISLYGVDGVLERRARNHVQMLANELDRAFYAEAYTAAENSVTIDDTLSIAENLETVIQQCENLQSDFVDGVPRSMMNLVCCTEYYGKIRNDLDKQQNSNVDTAAETFERWHGVKTFSSIHLPKGCKFMIIVDGAVAQPVMAEQYTAEKIGLSQAYGVSLFFHYGTKAVMPDLIFKVGE